MSEKFLYHFLKLREKPQILEHPVTNGPHDFNDLIDAVDLPLAVWILVSALRPMLSLDTQSCILETLMYLLHSDLGIQFLAYFDPIKYILEKKIDTFLTFINKFLVGTLQ